MTARRRLLVLAGLASLAVAGCECETPSDVVPTRDVDGAQIQVDRTSVRAGDPVVVDISGSYLDRGRGQSSCPQFAQVFLDGVNGPVKRLRRTGTGAEAMELRDTGGRCVVANGRFTLRLPAGGPGTKVKRTLTATTEEAILTTDGELTRSSSTATVIVTVVTPRPEQPGTPPTTGTPPAATLPTDVDCRLTAVPGGPQARLGVAPSPAVAGSAATVTAYPEDQARYEWDLDDDGVVDQDGPERTIDLRPAGDGARTVCVRVTAGDRTSSVAGLSVPTAAAGRYVAGDWTLPEGYAPAGAPETVTVAPAPAGTTAVAVDWGDGSATGDLPAPTSPLALQHAWAAAGTYRIVLTERAGDVVSHRVAWQRVVEGGGAASAAARRRVRSWSFPAALRTTRVRLVSRGRVSARDGVLRTRGLLVTGRVTGRLPKRLRRVRALAGVRALSGARFAARLDARRVDLGPESWGFAGRGVLLARKGATRLCLRVRSDGASTAGSRWTVLGATGAARGLRGGGTMAPLTLGKPPAPFPRGRATVRTGGATSMRPCAGLAKRLR